MEHRLLNEVVRNETEATLINKHYSAYNTYHKIGHIYVIVHFSFCNIIHPFIVILVLSSLKEGSHYILS